MNNGQRKFLAKIERGCLEFARLRYFLDSVIYVVIILVTSYEGSMIDQHHPHQQQSHWGVLLVNLGTPVQPTKKEVGRFLREFLSDTRVVNLPRALWWPILNGFIIPFRSSKLIQQYQKIWQAGGSPLLVNSQRVMEGLQKIFDDQFNSKVVVELGMSYGQPSIASGLKKLREKYLRKLIILPLYPQYSATTTGAVFDAVARELNTWAWVPELQLINHYADNVHYIQALVGSIQKRWQQERGDILLFSFHGLPERSLREGDPYYCYCQKTARLISEQLGLKPDQWRVVFQSRFGREAWFKPYCDQTLRELPSEGKRRVDIICPGFAVDCLETLEEVAIRNREIFLSAGGERYNYIPALNNDISHISALANIINEGCKITPSFPTNRLCEV